jgi:hypothetical protein
MVVCLCVLTCVGVVGAGVAWASAPETPTLEIQKFTDSSVFVDGELTPGVGPPQEGTYEYLYAVSSSSCIGGSKGPRGLMLDVPGQSAPEELTGLAPGTTYTICLMTRNLAGEESFSVPLSFTTSLRPEAPEIGAVESITSTTAMVHGLLNPHSKRESEPGSYQFVYMHSATECEGEGEGATEQVTITHGGVEREAVEQELTGLEPNTQYSLCLRTWNDTGQYATGSPVTFTTGIIGAPSVPYISTHSATVSAEVDTVGGSGTSYAVQYGTSTAYGSETKLGRIAGTETASVELTGLQPATEYHFRFIATDEAGTQASADVVFTTYPVPLGGTPDGRVYELVSRFSTIGTEVYVPFRNGFEERLSTLSPFETSASGDAIAFVGSPGPSGDGTSGAETAGNAYLASRGPGGDWGESVNVTPPGSIDSFYQGFSSDLNKGFVGLETVPPFTSEARYPVSREENEHAYSGLYESSFGEGGVRPLFGSVPRRKASEFEAFVATDTFGAKEFKDAVYAGSSADGSDALFEVDEDFLEGNSTLEKELAETVEKEIAGKRTFEEDGGNKFFSGDREEEEKYWSVEGRDDRNELYESVDGRSSLVNVSPEGKLVAGASFGGQAPGIYEESYRSGFTPFQPGLSHAISQDGSEVFWTSVEPEVGIDINHYSGLEERPLAVFVRIDGSRTVQVSAGPATFWTASPDGRYAFYTEAGGLWRFDVQDGERVELVGQGGGVKGVVGVNETGGDGEYAYFVSSEMLPGENMVGQSAVQGRDNMYAYEPEPGHPGASRIVFIGTLSSLDESDWSLGVGTHTADVTPDGHAVSFIAHENLTADSYPGAGSTEEAYVFDATDGSLYCASCRPQTSGGWFAGDNGSATYAPRSISENGNEVFFDSTAALSAEDVNGVLDVYEWERPGSGSCRETDGCVYMLSNGVEGPAYLVDASTSGDDVFIATAQHLTAEPHSESVELYDAHVGGSSPVEPPQCSGTGCQGVPAGAPIFATPASETFNGVGNFPPPTTVAKTVVKEKGKTVTRSQKLVKALKKCRKTRDPRERVVCEGKARKVYDSRSTKRKGR